MPTLKTPPLTRNLHAIPHLRDSSLGILRIRCSVTSACPQELYTNHEGRRLPDLQMLAVVKSQGRFLLLQNLCPRYLNAYSSTVYHLLFAAVYYFPLWDGRGCVCLQNLLAAIGASCCWKTSRVDSTPVLWSSCVRKGNVWQCRGTETENYSAM